MKKVLTIIVPTYNMELYLRYSLSSLLIKEEDRSKLDIIIVNDGSKDNSLNIAYEYQNLYPDAFRVIDKENGNYGSCINAALPKAAGKYIKILDADDSFNTNNLADYVLFLENNNYDLVLTDFDIVDNNRKTSSTCSFPFPTGKGLSIRDIANTNAFKGMQMHAVTYRTDILLCLQYKQTEGISYTDQEWVFAPMINIKDIYYYNKTIYRYLWGREGQTMSPAVRTKQIGDLITCLFSILDVWVCSQKIITNNIKDYLLYRILFAAKEIYTTCFLNYSIQIRDILKKFDCNLKDKNPYIYTYIAEQGKTIFKNNYIGIWRKFPNTPIAIVKVLCKLYFRLF